jgi:hypothetical protein
MERQRIKNNGYAPDEIEEQIKSTNVTPNLWKILFSAQQFRTFLKNKRPFSKIYRSKRKSKGVNVSMKKKRKKNKSHEKQKEKIAKKKLKRNSSIEGRSSSELESFVGFLSKVKNSWQCYLLSNSSYGSSIFVVQKVSFKKKRKNAKQSWLIIKPFQMPHVFMSGIMCIVLSFLSCFRESQLGCLMWVAYFKYQEWLNLNKYSSSRFGFWDLRFEYHSGQQFHQQPLKKGNGTTKNAFCNEIECVRSFKTGYTQLLCICVMMTINIHKREGCIYECPSLRLNPFHQKIVSLGGF